MKRILGLILLVVAMVGTGVYFYFAKGIEARDVPLEVIATENAMALPGTMAVASLDVKYIRRISKTLYGSSDPMPLITEGDENLLNALRKQGHNIFEQTDYALLAAGANKDDMFFGGILLGKDYPVDAIIKTLKDKYLVRTDKRTGSFLIKKESIETCKMSEEVAVYIEPHAILISTPKDMHQILSRLKTNAASEVNLTAWRDFRKNKISAIGVIAPKEIEKSVNNGMAKMMLKGFEDKKNVDSAFLGALVNLTSPQGLKLVAEISTKDHALLNKAEKGFYELKENFKDSLKKDFPTLSGLQRYSSVHVEDNKLKAKFIADKDFISDVKKIPEEFMRMMFSGFAVKSGTSANLAENVDRILEPNKIMKFKENANFTNLRNYEDKYAETPTLVQGPFSINISSIGISPDSDKAIELKLEVKSGPLVNIPAISTHFSEGGSFAEFNINRVEGADGHNLLKNERCGRNRNSKTAMLHANASNKHVDGKVIPYQYVIGDKKIRLNEGASLYDISAIKGTIKLSLATKVKTKTFKKPFDNQIFETENVRMFFKDGGSDKITYQITGKPYYILDVRPLNAKGQYLVTSGFTRMGENVSIDVIGTVSSVEIVYAEEMESKDYPFVIRDVLPKFNGKNEFYKPHNSVLLSKNQFIKQVSVPFEKPDNLCIEQTKTKAGEFLVCANKFDYTMQNLGSWFKLYAPSSDALLASIKNTTVTLNSMVDDKGYSHDLNIKQRFKFKEQFDNKKLIVSGSLRMGTDNKELADLKVKQVSGVIQVRLPKNLTPIVLNAQKFGETRAGENGFKVKLVSLENKSLTIEFEGDISNIADVRAKDINGEYLALQQLDIKEKSTFGLTLKQRKALEGNAKKWSIYLYPYGTPETIEIYYSSEFEEVDYPFNLKF
ncbi:MAG: hypothetical protein ACI9TY_000235 [Alphaproteobacteria bacterium]|jgi:hypothetical protein